MIGVSLIATMSLIKSNKPPAEASTPTEVRSLTVTAFEAFPEDVTVHLNGFGEVRSKHTVTLSAEISGRVVHVHPNLDVGSVRRLLRSWRVCVRRSGSIERRKCMRVNGS